MTSARRIAERAVIGGAALAFLSTGVAVAPALAQGPSAGDPSPGSPAGVIYRLPVDDGRRDAAPRPDGKPSGGGVPGSTFRSDNNFGTSSTVPGDPRTGKDGAGSSANGADGQAGGAGGGTGAGGAGGENLALAGAADTGDPSEPFSLLLLLAIVGVGAVLGVGAARSARNSGQ